MTDAPPALLRRRPVGEDDVSSKGVAFARVLGTCVARGMVAMCAAAMIADGRGAQAGINVWASNGLAGVYVKSLAIDPSTPSTLYAGTGRWFGDGSAIGDVYKSTDGGGSWSPANMRLRNPVTALAIDPTTPSTLYAGTYVSTGSPGGVFKSTNAGNTWEAVDTGLPTADISVVALAIDPTTPTTLYAGTYSYGVFKSTDGAGTWAVVNAGLPTTAPSVSALAIDPTAPDTLYAGVAYDSSSGVYKSTDGGNTWSNTWNDIGSAYVFALAVDPIAPGTLYAGTAFVGILKSTDGGTTWGGGNYLQFMETIIRALAIDPNQPSTLFAAGDGVFRSTDAGGSWQHFDTGLPCCVGVEALIIDPTSMLYAGTIGVFSIEIPCADDGNACTYDVYDDTGTCHHPSAAQFHPCWDDGNACTDDVCDGAGLCTHPDNTAPCDDGNACTAHDTCGGGACVPGGPPAACATAFPAKARLDIRADADPAKARQKLEWKWRGADAFNVTALGHPRTTDDLVLCGFDQTGLVFEASAPAAGTCAGVSCWSYLGGRVKYVDSDATPDGLTKLQAKSGSPGRGKVQVQGKGANLALPSLPLIPPVSVHLARADGSACWRATYSNPAGITKNEPTGFKAKSD